MSKLHYYHFNLVLSKPLTRYQYDRLFDNFCDIGGKNYETAGSLKITQKKWNEIMEILNRK